MVLPQIAEFSSGAGQVGDSSMSGVAAKLGFDVLEVMDNGNYMVPHVLLYIYSFSLCKIFVASNFYPRWRAACNKVLAAGCWN